MHWWLGKRSITCLQILFGGERGPCGNPGVQWDLLTRRSGKNSYMWAQSFWGDSRDSFYMLLWNAETHEHCVTARWCSCQPPMKPCFHGVDEHVVGRFGTTLLECCDATPRRSCFVRSSSASRQMRQPLSQTLVVGQNQFQELAQRPLPELW